jgi:hypothetical protein
MPSSTQEKPRKLELIDASERVRYDQILDAAGGDTFVGILFSEDYRKVILKVHDADTREVIGEHEFRAGPDAQAWERQNR